MEVTPNQNSDTLESQELQETNLKSELSADVVIDNPFDEPNLPTFDPSLVQNIASSSPQLVVGADPTLATIAAPIIDVTQTFYLSSLAGAAKLSTSISTVILLLGLIGILVLRILLRLSTTRMLRLGSAMVN